MSHRTLLSAPNAGGIDALSIDGVELFAGALTAPDLTLLADVAVRWLGGGPGARIAQDAALSELLRRGGTMDSIAKARLGYAASAVRALLLDKRRGSNWTLGWHQDRTIAVRSTRRRVLQVDYAAASLPNGLEWSGI
jgi:hypothetical protein